MWYHEVQKTQVNAFSSDSYHTSVLLCEAGNSSWHKIKKSSEKWEAMFWLSFFLIYILENGGEGLHNSGFVASKAVNEVFHLPCVCEADPVSLDTDTVLPLHSIFMKVLLS
jgi:hypothetical protein